MVLGITMKNSYQIPGILKNRGYWEVLFQGNTHGKKRRPRIAGKQSAGRNRRASRESKTHKKVCPKTEADLYFLSNCFVNFVPQTLLRRTVIRKILRKLTIICIKETDSDDSASGVGTDGASNGRDEILLW